MPSMLMRRRTYHIIHTDTHIHTHTHTHTHTDTHTHTQHIYSHTSLSGVITQKSVCIYQSVCLHRTHTVCISLSVSITHTHTHTHTLQQMFSLEQTMGKSSDRTPVVCCDSAGS